MQTPVACLSHEACRSYPEEDQGSVYYPVPLLFYKVSKVLQVFCKWYQRYYKTISG